MRSDAFTRFREELNRSCEDILLKKGADYSGPTDRHRNFKEGATALGLRPLQVWAVFFKKHLDALFTYVREEKVQSEPILERVKDARNYLDLGAALIQEIEDGKAKTA
jgi:hypothetical protein